MNKEKWKVIPTKTCNYQISNFGRIKSKSRYIFQKTGRRFFWKERILTAHLGGNGYFCIVLDGVNYWVHRLVALAFIPNPDHKKCVNHKDGVKTNNHEGNLEWVDHKENMLHFGKQKGMRKMKDIEIIRIYQARYEENLSFEQIHKRFDRSLLQIRDICFLRKPRYKEVVL